MDSRAPVVARSFGFTSIEIARSVSDAAIQVSLPQSSALTVNLQPAVSTSGLLRSARSFGVVCIADAVNGQPRPCRGSQFRIHLPLEYSSNRSQKNGDKNRRFGKGKSQTFNSGGMSVFSNSPFITI